MNSGCDQPGGDLASPSVSERLQGARPSSSEGGFSPLGDRMVLPAGLARRRQVQLCAKLADAFARAVITLGGVGVIITVFGVFVYLLWVVVPLFLPGSIEPVAFLPWPPGAKLSDHWQLLSRGTPPEGNSIGVVEGSHAAQASQANNAAFLEVNGPLAGGGQEQDSGVFWGEEGASGFTDDGVRQIRRAAFSSSTLAIAPPQTGALRDSLLGAKPGGSTQRRGELPPEGILASSKADPIWLMVDETASIVAVVGRGWVRQIAIAGGSLLGETTLLPADVGLTGWHFDPDSGRWFAGTENGELYLGSWIFELSYPAEESLPESLRSLPVGGSQPFEGGVISRPAREQFRVVTGRAQSGEPVKLTDTPIVLLDGVKRGNVDVIVAVAQDSFLYTYSLLYQKNLLTGRTTTRISGGRLELKILAERGWPEWLLVGGQGDTAVALWNNGWYQRYDLGDPTNPKLAEEGVLATASLGEPVQATFVLGRNTFVLAHRKGRISAWFPVSLPDVSTADRRALVCGHVIGPEDIGPSGLAPGRRGRFVAVGYKDGSIRVFHTTSERQVAVWNRGSQPAPIALAFSPKDDFLVAVTPLGIEVAAVRVPHPEVSWKAIWGRVWYENYPRPSFVWQSTGGTDDFEPKYGLVPLVFGTAKATFYSLLFGLPLGLLGAIYASEFLHPRVRNRIKTVVELMASLPSVVLGFVAAFVMAPLVEGAVPEVLCIFGTLPVALLACGYLWEMLPYRWRSSGTLRAVGIFGSGGLGIFLAWQVGPWSERLLFQGDIKGWLSGTGGEPWGGWVLLLMPVAVGATVWINARWLGPVLYRSVFTRSPIVAGSLRVAKLALCVVISLLLAFITAWIASSLFGDPRGNVLGTYVQRNALVVGVIMGFAIVPLIFTLAEDALSAVPQDLRAASLGAGATPWQTAFRVVIPAAMSGLFSAAMIGLARAAGETMIVLMAAGNTPIMEWNPFNGFRTLSANIAVELPEAVQNSTHYRMLFFAALCLFVLTSIVNTAAELVRLRFRKRASQL